MKIQVRSPLVLALLSTSCVLAACGSDANDTPTPTADAGSDTLAPVDSGTPDGADTGVDPVAAPKTLVQPLSAAGHDRLFNVVFEPSGSFYAVGVAAPGTDAATDFATVIVKFKPDGTLDATFGTAGVATKNLTVGTNGEVARGIVLQSDGKIVVAATVEHVGAADARDRDLAVARFDKAGQLDTTFGTGGVTILDLSDGEVSGTSYVADAAWGVAVYPDDRLVVSGGQKRTGAIDTDYALVRLTKDGARDTTFGANGVFTLDIDQRNGSQRSVIVLPDGKVVGAGYMTNGDSVTVPVVYRVDDKGVIDPTFGVAGVFSQQLLPFQSEAYAAAAQGTSLVAVGYGKAKAADTLDILSYRISAAGKHDTTYGTAGLTQLDVGGFNDNARSLLILPDDRVMLVGAGRRVTDDADGLVGILTKDGAPDTTFAPKGLQLFDLGGANDFLWGSAISPSKKLVVIVGIKGIASGATGDDDAALVLFPLR